MGIRHLHYPLSGIQFHPESYLTEVGEKIMANWIDICRKQTKAAIKKDA
ncbi:MAG TPA: hypothetical protein VE868_11825 [Balneolaceae bacterium]|nr:hypothetical protein [Balneolaceae bacterium]